MAATTREKILTGLAIAITGCVYAAGLISNDADPDLWGYLAFGHQFWTLPDFPYQDSFSYMPTKEVWVYHEWLTGAIFFPLYAAFGEVSLQALRYALALGALWFAFGTALKRGATPFWALMGLLLAGYAICPGYSPVRAQVFTYYFFTLTIYICERAKRNEAPASLWLLAPIFLIWSNLHGGFLAGFCVLGLYSVGRAISGERFFPFAAALLLCLALTLVNPYGLGYWEYLIKALSMPRHDVMEWASILESYQSGDQLSLHLFICLTVIAGVLGALRWRRNPTAILILAGTAWMGFSHVRHLVFFGLAFAAYVPPAAAGFFSTSKSNDIQGLRRVAHIFVILPSVWLLGLSAIITYQGMTTPNFLDAPFSLKALPASEARKDQIYYPVGGMKFLRENGISGNILSEFTWGEFIMWSLPKSKVAMDGRYETVYPKDIGEEYFNFINAGLGWESYLRDYSHEIAIFRPDSPARGLTESMSEWETVYSDQGCTVLFNLNRIPLGALGHFPAK